MSLFPSNTHHNQGEGTRPSDRQDNVHDQPQLYLALGQDPKGLIQFGLFDTFNEASAAAVPGVRIFKLTELSDAALQQHETLPIPEPVRLPHVPRVAPPIPIVVPSHGRTNSDAPPQSTFSDQQHSKFEHPDGAHTEHGTNTESFSQDNRPPLPSRNHRGDNDDTRHHQSVFHRLFNGL